MPVAVDGSRPLRVGACLSLSGRFARFGSQAASALATWKLLDGHCELVLDDDESDPRVLERALPRLARNCDVLLSPYSTQLVRIAGRIAADEDLIVWNHGGSGDDVEASQPGHLISVLTPASKYAEPFIRHLKGSYPPAQLWITNGKGAFGRQVADGAARAAERLGVDFRRVPMEHIRDWSSPHPGTWDLLSAGTFEDDTGLIQDVMQRSPQPRATFSVAAGVRDFASAVQDTQGIYGVGQWFPGIAPAARLGPGEPAFLTAYAARHNALPDYPAVQAVAAATLATHSIRQAGTTARDAVWAFASELVTSTLFGPFDIDPTTGVQAGHETVLLRWAAGTLTWVSPLSVERSS